MVISCERALSIALSIIYRFSQAQKRSPLLTYSYCLPYSYCLTACLRSSTDMAYGHALVSSRLFVLFVILNHATDFFINSTSDVGAQTKTWHSFYLGQMVICGGYTTLSFCSFGSDIAIVSFRRRFFGRRLLYSPNGTSSFNPSTLQLILRGIFIHILVQVRENIRVFNLVESARKANQALRLTNMLISRTSKWLI